MAQYRHCVLGPVAMPSANVGFPDGDNRPTVTMDYRRTYTLSPTNGQITFGLGTGYHGCFIKGRGVLDTAVPVVSGYISASGTVTADSAATNFVDGMTGLVPIVNYGSSSTSVMPAYRPLVAVLEAVFTGSTMQNGGSVTISKASSANSLYGEFGSTTARPRYGTQVARPVMSASSVVGPARDSYTSRVVPADPEFVALGNAAIGALANSTVAITNGLITSNSSGTNAKACSLPCNQAGVIWYDYTGLDSTATITVSVRYCVQYSVSGDSEMVPLAKPSPPPPENPGMLNRIFSAITASPAALTFAANAVGFAVPSARPLLAIAAEAYNHS